MNVLGNNVYATYVVMWAFPDSNSMLAIPLNFTLRSCTHCPTKISPEPEVTCGTVAIIIRVVLLSPYLRIRAVSLFSIHYNQSHCVYRVSQEECEIIRESVPYVKLYRYNSKHLYPKLNGFGDNGQRKVWTSCISAYCTSTAFSPLTFKVQCSHPIQ